MTHSLAALRTRIDLAWLLALAIGCAVAFASVYAAGRMVRHQEAVYLEALASAEARQIDLQLETYKAALLTVANSDALVQADDLAILRREAMTIAEHFGGWFVLATGGDTLEVLMTTATDGPLPLPEPRSAYPEVRAAEQEALRTGLPAVSDAFTGRIRTEPVVTLAVPVPARDVAGPGRFLYMSFDTGHLSRLLSLHYLPANQFSAIADGSRRVIGHSQDIERYQLAPLPPWFVRATQGLDSVVVEGAPIGAPEATRVFAMERLSAAPNWTLVVSAPSRPLLLAGLGSVWPALATLVTILAISGVMAARGNYRRVAAARQQAEAVAQEKSELLEALQASERRKATLIGVVGHELRTPLIAQLGLLDLLEADAKDADASSRLERARREGHGMLGLLDDLLEVARLGTGEVKLRPAKIEPRRLMEEVAAILRPLAARNGNVVLLDLRGDLSPLWADEAALRRILLNFGTNATKFTSNGTITLMFEARAVSERESMVTLAVRDTGVGIAAQDIPKLFKEFGMLEANRELAAGGSGLGLAICKGLADAMGGRVGIDSRPGKGSLFKAEVTLPHATAVPPAERPNPLVDLQGLSILLAEDQDIIRKVTAQQLIAAGASVETAADGHYAVARAERVRFDLILMDLRMPNLDGAAAARCIRAGKGPNAETTIIGLTAHQTAETAAILSNGGISACLTKPLVLQDLAQVLGRPAPQGSSGCSPAPTSGLIDVEAVTWLIEEPDFVADLFAKLDSEVAAALIRIETAQEAGDLAAVSDTAHRLSGLAKVCGASGLGQALDRLDSAARAAVASDVMRALDEVKQCAAQTRDALAEATPIPT